MAKVCRRTGKQNYRSQAAAAAGLRHVQEVYSLRERYHNPPIAYYRCPACPYWHLTSKKQYGPTS